MRFRPCIDIHNGKVKQIVGGSLRDEGDRAKTNFTAVQDAGMVCPEISGRSSERRAYHFAESAGFALL